MRNIISINKNRATIEFPEFCIRIFTKYRGNYCSEIRIWKLPPGGNFWHMFNTKNLVWAMYDNDAAGIHGYFTPPPITKPNDKRHWLEVLTNRIANCKNFDEIKSLLINIEGMLSGDVGAEMEIDDETGEKF